MNRSRRCPTRAPAGRLLCCLLATVVTLAFVSASTARAAPERIEPQITVDQFGYQPLDRKVAAVATAIRGIGSRSPFRPGPRYQVRRWSDDTVVFQGRLVPWRRGQIHDQSGNRVYHFNFSRVRTPGSYYLYDVARGVGSGRFEIGADVYVPVLDAALKMFWFNRANIPHEGDLAEQWTDAAAFVGPGQDTEARDVRRPNDASTARDMSGGWFDAGDTNKYVTFAAEAVHQLLNAWQNFPEAFDDDHGIPESGNGVPDIVDEVLWELAWLEKMQDDDGGVFIKVGKTNFTAPSPPSSDRSRRFYERKCSSSSIAASAMFAHAALVLRELGIRDDLATRFRGRAYAAWRWYWRNPQSATCDAQIVKSGDADWSLVYQRQHTVAAAIYLYALDANPAFDRYIASNMGRLRLFTLNDYSAYETAQGDALLYYTRLPNASAATRSRILNRLASLQQWSTYFGVGWQRDAYSAYMPDYNYHWGSNMVKANIGVMNFETLYAGVAPERTRFFRYRGFDHLHYLHGVNPLSKVYLSNMRRFGAERSVNEVFHYWYEDGTRYDNANRSEVGPAPGYFPGGPNLVYSGSVAPPLGQPAQKAFRDWNGVQNDGRSWEITEPAIYFQSAYIRLLSAAIADHRRRSQ